MKRTLAMALVAAVLTIAVSLWAYTSGSRTLHVRAGELTTAIAAANLGNELSGSSGPHASGRPDPTPVVQHAQAWAKKITLASAATGLGLTALILLTTGLWQRNAGSQTGSGPHLRGEALGGQNSSRTGTASPTHRSARAEAPAKTTRSGSPGSGPHPAASASAEALIQQLRFELATHSKQRRDLQTELNDLKTQFDKKLDERTAAVSAELNQRKQAERTLSQQRQELERSKDVLELHVQARTQQLQTLQRRYEHILNSAGEGIYGLDMTGKTTFVNPAAAKLTGYTVEELSGKPEHQTLLRDPSGGASSIEPLTASPDSGPHASGEQTFYRKDGSAILVEYTRTPIIENAKQMGAVVTFKDITERKRAEETLARKAAELARSNGELEQFAYVASHDLQEPLRKIRAFGDRLKTTIDQLTSARAEALGGASSVEPSTSGRAEAPGNTQLRRRKKSSDTAATTATAVGSSPFPGGEGQGEGKTGNPAVTSARDYLERMQNAAARMQTLINDLLTFSRVVSTTQPFVPVDLAAVTREVLGDLEIPIQQTGAKIHLGDLPTIHADPLQMRQLLQNIIANALKFQPTSGITSGSPLPRGEGQGEGQNGSVSPHTPEIHITAQLLKKPFASAAEPTPDDQICELSIQDNGIGFDPKYTEKIFAMFQRLHGRAEYEGTGVGLAVCRRITDRHSGTITATSELGKGSTFIIRLPVHQTNKEEQPS